MRFTGDKYESRKKEGDLPQLSYVGSNGFKLGKSHHHGSRVIADFGRWGEGFNRSHNFVGNPPRE